MVRVVVAIGRVASMEGVKPEKSDARFIIFPAATLTANTPSATMASKDFALSGTAVVSSNLAMVPGAPLAVSLAQRKLSSAMFATPLSPSL